MVSNTTNTAKVPTALPHHTAVLHRSTSNKATASSNILLRQPSKVDTVVLLKVGMAALSHRASTVSRYREAMAERRHTSSKANPDSSRVTANRTTNTARAVIVSTHLPPAHTGRRVRDSNTRHRLEGRAMVDSSNMVISKVVTLVTLASRAGMEVAHRPRLGGSGCVMAA